MFTALPDLGGGRYDVLVVGSGPAGLAVAGALGASGARVLVVESGGAKAHADDLNRVETTGLPYPGAETGRARGWGGTGEKWAGQCRPLDPLDLQARSWVEGSGWPLTPHDLAPWIERASSFFSLDGATYSPADVEGTRVVLPEVDPALLQWRVLRYSPAHRVGSKLRSSVAADAAVTVVTDATVVELLQDDSGVIGVRAVSAGGHERRLLATDTVLAAGGLENARLLLLAGEGGAPVPGNAGGWVGRSLQDHPHWLVGELVDADPAVGVAFQSASAPGGRARAKLALPSALQEARQTLNAVLDIELVHGPGSAAGASKRLWEAYQQRRRPDHPVADVATLLRHPVATAGELRARRGGTGAPADRHTSLGLRVQTEQPPLGESCVSLGEARDRYGCRVASVHWTVGEMEHRTCLELSRAAQAAFAGAGLGRVVLAPWLEELDQFRARAEDFYHHAGTTRMAATEQDGVVSPSGAVHGTAHLHVAGGSVFPTSGYANPTLTIVALALRLADHLSD